LIDVGAIDDDCGLSGCARWGWLSIWVLDYHLDLAEVAALDGSGPLLSCVPPAILNSSEDEVNVQSETDRYIVRPAQALGYMIWPTRDSRELRHYAKDQLGDKFDIRVFHDEVLGRGALPMEVLKERIQELVALQKSPVVSYEAN
jgi:Bacterial protein of unknown function (DUF885)